MSLFKFVCAVPMDMFWLMHCLKNLSRFPANVFFEDVALYDEEVEEEEEEEEEEEDEEELNNDVRSLNINSLPSYYFFAFLIIFSLFLSVNKLKGQHPTDYVTVPGKGGAKIRTGVFRA